jgi:hypothetical protein
MKKHKSMSHGYLAHGGKKLQGNSDLPSLLERKQMSFRSMDDSIAFGNNWINLEVR